MGVKGLLTCLQSITRSVSLERYRGLTAAVDAMSWLHKGVFACDVRVLARSQRGIQCDKPTSAELKCIEYTTNKAETLRVKFGIEVILVIDGDALPSKDEENMQRREERAKAFEKAMTAEKAKDSRSARRFYAQSCSVTHTMRYELIRKCNELGLAYLVAPYEADAQMARLAHTGVVDLVITEDSDILVYGCPRALFKVNFATYQGQEIQLMRDLGENAAPSFRNWTHDMFVFMCIISGCDYCKGVPGIGIKLAHKLVRIHRTPSKIFAALRAAGRMPPDFEEKFFIAFRTFRHQRVFCPSKQQIETLWPITGSNHGGSNGEWPFLGEYVEPHVARKIADGTLHPSKKIPWQEALKRHHECESMPTEVDRRMSSVNPDTRNQRIDNNQKSNIWYSLVYGQNDSNQRGDSSDQDTSKREVFSFFPKNKNHGAKEDMVETTAKSELAGKETRLPLQVICVGPDLPASKPKSNYVPPVHHRDLPIHFDEYASRLVGRAFNPISRKRKRLGNDGTKSANYVQKIWEKCVKIRESVVHEDQVLKINEKEKKTEGVNRFSKDQRREMPTFRFADEYENDYSKIDFCDSNNEKCDTLASFSVHNQAFDYTRQDCHLPVSGDELVYPSLDFYMPQLVGTHNFYPKDLDSAVTTCGEVYSGNRDTLVSSIFSHPPIFEPRTHDDPRQSRCLSEYTDTRSALFNDTDIDDELQTYHDLSDRYGINDYMVDFEGENLYEQLRTVTERNRSELLCHHLDTVGCAVEDFRTEERRKAMKAMYGSFNEDSVAGNVDSSFYWSECMFGGRDRHHDTVW
ncbi:hypothetical protein ACHAW5_002454 [Stephanodiscus triporus]|uniref:Exonuclease 1 n=1 Tax=Stephanodiscus triporus TaxID=2934178 RepID=A0ABD3Q664_9STRA